MRETGVGKLAIALLIQLVVATQASALSCASPPFEWQYLHSKYVFVANLISVEQIKDTQQHVGGSPKWRHQIRVSESFKEPVPFDNILTGSAWPGFRAHFKEGESVLFFMNDARSFGLCSPKHLVGTESTTSILTVLRDYKAGRRDSISGTWHASSQGKRCSVGFVDYTPNTFQRFSLQLIRENATLDTLGAHIEIGGLRVFDLDPQQRKSLAIKFGEHSLNIPYNEKQGKYTTIVTNTDKLLSEIIAGRSPLLRGQLPREGHFEIGLHLNGGTSALVEFAQCADLELKTIETN